MNHRQYWEDLRSQLQTWNLSRNDDKENRGNIKENAFSHGVTKQNEDSTHQNPAMKDIVSSELMAEVFEFLTMEEILQCSLVNHSFLRITRCDAVWKKRLLRRWNCNGEDIMGDYYSAYQRAHINPHDLWLTHWDIVYPSNGLERHRSLYQQTDHESHSAFDQAATFHRRLRLPQYNGCPTESVTDLLFFNLTDPTSSQGQWELEQLAASEVLPENARCFDTAHHSWHIVKFRNVDPYRPMFVQIGIQRPECFTVYPSEAYIEPGKWMFVTFGVTSFGASLAYAFEGLNVFRDGLPVEWSDRYTTEAHLPLCPFIVRYHFVPTPPLRWKAQGHFPEVFKHQNVPSHQTRVIRLSAHVNAHYHYEQFRSRTKQLFSYYVNPEAWERDPELCLKLQTVLWDDSKWILNMGRNHQTPEANNPSKSQRGIRLENLCRFVGALCDGSIHGNAADISVLIYTAYSMIKSFLASPIASQQLVQILLRMDSILDFCYKNVPVGGEAWVPWRTSGCYRNVLATDSVFHSGQETLHIASTGDDIEWKDEPHYLETFRYLTHSPGRFCLGPQEDINHLGETVKESRYHRSQVGNVTDVFMNDPVFAFQAGVCMISDPRSLSVHGIYDWIPYPGTAVRRPRISACPGLDLQDYPRVPSKSNIRWFLESHDGTNTNVSCLPYSLLCFLNGTPPADRRDYTFSYLYNNDVLVPLNFDDNEGWFNNARSRASEQAVQDDEAANVNGNGLLVDQGANNQPRPHMLLQVVGMLGARVGLAISDEHGHSPVYVERTILIASQWVSVSFMAAPLFITLVGRHWRWIPTEPVQYMLYYDELNQNKEMRFLSESECGLVAAIMFVYWLALARWTERNTCRDFFRVIQEHSVGMTKNAPAWKQFLARLLLRYQKRWDSICPLFLQRKLYTPFWNKRSLLDLNRHVAHVRSRNLPWKSIRASTMLPKNVALFGDERDVGLETETSVSSSHKLLIGIVVALGSFCSTTPHFWLNLVTIFSCSISMGMSVSLHSIEKGRSEGAVNAGSMLETFSVVTVVILAFMVGQLVGSSGGTMFLCEFVVTAVSLILGGGAGTVSARTIESWCSFFVLSSAGLWGYLFGRVALLDGIRQRRGCHSTVLLSNAVGFLALFWVLLFFFAKWATPTHLVVVEPSFVFAEGVDKSIQRSRMARRLQ